MKLATLHDGSRDGRLVVVSRDTRLCVAVPEIARTLQDALDRWPEVSPRLAEAARRLDAGGFEGNAQAFSPADCLPPLPRAFQWIEALPTPAHVARLGVAMGFTADDLLPGTLGSDGARPFLRQGASDSFAGPGAGIPVPATVSAATDGRFDAEPGLVVLLGDVPMGTAVEDAAPLVHLVGLYAGVVQRTPPSQGTVPGMAFFESRPLTLFAPIVVTLDELGAPWNDGRATMGLHLSVNGERLAELNPSRRAGAGFGALIVAAARTRGLGAGTMIGSGPLSSGEGAPAEDGTAALGLEHPGPGDAPHDPPTAPPPAGSIAEWRDRARAQGLAREAMRTWLRPGDTVEVEAFDTLGSSLFGAIRAPVTAYTPPRGARAPAGEATAPAMPGPEPLPEIAMLLAGTATGPVPILDPPAAPTPPDDAAFAPPDGPGAPTPLPQSPEPSDAPVAGPEPAPVVAEEPAGAEPEAPVAFSYRHDAPAPVADPLPVPVTSSDLDAGPDGAVDAPPARTFASPVQMLLHGVASAAPGQGWPAPLKPLTDDADDGEPTVPLSLPPIDPGALMALLPFDDAVPPSPPAAPAAALVLAPGPAADDALAARAPFGERVDRPAVVTADDTPTAMPAPARYHLYGFWRSSSSWRVRLALAFKGLDWDTTPTDIVHARAQDRPSFKALTPQTRVPVLEDRQTGLVLNQSMAILDWLEQAHPAPPLLPADPRLRARVMMFCQTVATDIQPLQNTGVMSWLTDQLGASTAERTRWARHWIERGLDALEAERNAWLAGEAAAGRAAPYYCFTDHPTWADCCLVPQVFNARRFGCDLRGFLGLVALADRLEREPAFARAHPDHQPDARPEP